MSKKFLDSFAADKRQSESKRGTVQKESHPSEVFVGQIKDWVNPSGLEGKRTIVAAEGMEQISDEIQNNYQYKAFMTMEGLIRPVSMNGYGGLPPFIDYSTPVGTSGLVVQDDLVPFTNPSGFPRSSNARIRTDTPLIGHDFEILGRSGTVENTPSGGMIMPLAGFTNEFGSDYTDDYGAFALRGPLLVAGWGFDTEGYPVPNKADDSNDAAQGNFITSGRDSTKFLDGYLRKPQTWPVAPVDLRLDRARGVWTVGEAAAYIQRVKIGKAGSDILPNSSGLVNIHRQSSIGNVPPTSTGETQLSYHDWMTGGLTLPSGTQLVITYFDDEDIWRITGAEC